MLPGPWQDSQPTVARSGCSAGLPSAARMRADQLGMLAAFGPRTALWLRDLETGAERLALQIVTQAGQQLGRERGRRGVLDPLVDRQNDELARAGEAPCVHEAPEVTDDSGILSSVVRENGFYSITHPDASSFVRGGTLAQGMRRGERV